MPPGEVQTSKYWGWLYTPISVSEYQSRKSYCPLLRSVAGSEQDEFPTDTMFEKIAHCMFPQARCQKEIKDTLPDSAAMQ